MGCRAEGEGEDVHGTGWVLDPVPTLAPKPRPSSGLINPCAPPQAHRGCRSSAQCHPTAACPTSGHHRAEKKAPQQGAEGEPRLKPTPGHPVGPWAAASSNKEQWMGCICIVGVETGSVLPSASLFCMYGHLVLHYLRPSILPSTHPPIRPSPLLAAHAGYGAGPHTPPIGTCREGPNPDVDAGGHRAGIFPSCTQGPTAASLILSPKGVNTHTGHPPSHVLAVQEPGLHVSGTPCPCLSTSELDSSFT